MKKKQSKGRQKRRMTELDIRMVIEEIEAWRNGERGSKLTWAKLERIFPFTRQTMYSKFEIRSAFEERGLKKKSIKTNGICSSNEVTDLTVQRLRNRIAELELQLEEFQKAWIKIKI